MKSIKDCISIKCIAPEAAKQPQNEASKDRAVQLINNLFHRLQSLLPAFNQTWPNQEILDGSKRIWLEAFINNNINTAAQIKMGLDNLALRTNPFAPTVGEFMALCVPQPAKLGVPTHKQAYDEAVRRSYPGSSSSKWSHAVVYHSWFETGSRALNQATGAFQIKEIRTIFYKNYDLALKMFANGEQLRAIPKFLSEPEYKHEITQKGLDAFKKLKEITKG